MTIDLRQPNEDLVFLRDIIPNSPMRTMFIKFIFTHFVTAEHWFVVRTIGERYCPRVYALPRQHLALFYKDLQRINKRRATQNNILENTQISEMLDLAVKYTVKELVRKGELVEEN